MSTFPLWVWLKLVIHSRRIERRYPTSRVHHGATAEKTPLGRHVILGPGARLFHSDVGDFTYFAGDSTFNFVTLGKFCSVGPGVRAGVGLHPTRTFATTHPAFYSRALRAGVTFADREMLEAFRPIRIGNDVWIGANAVLLDGITIGNGAIVAAGAVVSKDVAAYSITGGVPAREIRKRFDAQEIAFLETFEWWDKPEDWLRANWTALHDVAALRRLG